MKKVISIMLALVMLLSFAACNKKGTSTPQETLPLDVEVLKTDWKKGELLFPGDKKASLLCTLSEFLEESGAKINSQKSYEGKMLEPKEELTMFVSTSGANIKLKVRNTGKETVGYLDAKVIGYSYSNTNEANRQIKFAGTLTPGVTRADVEKALEIPEGRTKEDSFYIYEARNQQNRKLQLMVSFNSDDIVNSVSFEFIYN